MRRCTRLRLPRPLAVAGFMLCAALVILPWAMLPVPTFPRPGGRYAVGTVTYRWVDRARDETITADPKDRRSVIAQAWYPAIAPPAGMHSVYIDGLGRLPEFVSLMPGFAMRHYGRVDTHGLVSAPAADELARWPVVLFSHGYGASRAFYTGLLTNLASRGFVVFALDHPYESAVTELADGRIATTVERAFRTNADAIRFMEERLEPRVQDVLFVLDRIQGGLAGSPLAGRLDTARIAAVGHSFGGATAAEAAGRDARIRAAVNIDGTLYGATPGRHLRIPFLLLESDRRETAPSDAYLEGNRRLLEHLAARGSRQQIERANHYSFTDAPLLLSPPARWVLSQFVGGSRGAQETHRISTVILDGFLRTSFWGDAGTVR